MLYITKNINDEFNFNNVQVMIDQLNDVLARQNCPADELIDVYQPLLNCTLDIIGG